MRHILPKALASTVNCSIVFAITAPVYVLLGIEWWRGACLSLFFFYNLLLRHRCLGMMIAKTRFNAPANCMYAALYTASFTTLLFWIWVPFDLAFANGLFLQLPCLLVKKNTLHGHLAGRRTMTEEERLFECIALKGECPDCSAQALRSSGLHLVCCLACHASFITQQFSVRRTNKDETLHLNRQAAALAPQKVQEA